MNIKAGTFLISAPSLEEPHFKKAVIFVTEHNDKGTVGFVINKLFHRKFNELEEFKHSIDFPLHAGGPVDKEHVFFLHHRHDLIEGGTRVIDSIYMGGNFKEAVNIINQLVIPGNDIKLFIGYCGWDANELEEEVKEGSWLIVDADSEIVFSPDVEKLWHKLYEGVNAKTIKS